MMVGWIRRPVVANPERIVTMEELLECFDGLQGMVKDLRESAKRPLVQPNEARILNRCAEQLEKYLVKGKEGA